jgi:hypothetical protein
MFPPASALWYVDSDGKIVVRENAAEKRRKEMEMGRFYGTKIRNAEINPKTGEAWTLEDVPRLWKHATEVWLADHEEA